MTKKNYQLLIVATLFIMLNSIVVGVCQQAIRNFCYVQISDEVSQLNKVQTTSLNRYYGYCASFQIEFTLDNYNFVATSKELGILQNEILQIIQKWQDKHRFDGEGENTIHYLKNLLEVYPNSGDAMFALGQEYFSQRQFVEASSTYSTIISLSLEGVLYKQSDLLVLLAIANQENRSNQWKAWEFSNLQLLEESINMDQFSKLGLESYAKLQLGIDAYRQREYVLAKQLLSESLDNEPNSYYGNLFLALVYEHEAALDEAISHLDRALEARKRWHWYQVFLFEKVLTLNMIVGDRERALELATTANELFPQNPNIAEFYDELTQ